LLTFYLAEGTGSGDWAAAYQKAKAFVGKLTPEEKVNLTAGTFVSNGCSGNISPIPRLDFPGFCVSDAGNGLVSSYQQHFATRC
jgi:beta-glucosidase